MSFFEMDGRLLLILFTFALSISSVESACVPPREGIWTVTLYEPPIKFYEPCNGYLNLQRHPKLPNVYTGNSVAFVSSLGPRTAIPFVLHAVFDEEECRLYGTNISPLLSIRDEFGGIVEGGEEMHGLFIARLGESFPIPYTCMTKLQFSGENTNANIVSLLTNPTHPYLNTTSYHSL